MSYDTARRHKKGQAAYRANLREARATAIRLAGKLMQDALDGKNTRESIQDDGSVKTEDYVPKEAVQAMAEILKEAREVFGEDGPKGKGNKPGIRTTMTTDEAEKALE